MRSDFFWMGGMWIFPMIMFAIMILVVLLILFSGFGKNIKFPCNHHPMGKSAMDILKERYAKGEISREEYERMKRDLSD